jgi:hypothetical protein
MSTTTSTLRMKLLIDTKANRAVFAEVDKDAVDFLFSLLALPVAKIVEMLGKGSMPGSFGNLYGSVEKLDDSYVLPGAEKKTVLQPAVVPSAASTRRSSLLLAPSSGQSSPNRWQSVWFDRLKPVRSGSGMGRYQIGSNSKFKIEFKKMKNF